MINIQSPFLKEIPECKVVMRKLRKKIYKQISASRAQKKTRDQNQDILNILKSRNLPNFVIDPLKKKRTIDFNFLKNVMISNMASPEQISKLTSNQQNQIQTLFAEHKQRLRKSPKKAMGVKFDKKLTNYTSEQEQSEQISMMSHQKIQIMNQEILANNIEFNYNFEYDGFMVNGQSFISLGKELDSEQDWLRF